MKRKASRDKVSGELRITQLHRDFRPEAVHASGGGWEASYVRTTTPPEGRAFSETLVTERGATPIEAKKKVVAALRSAGIKVPSKVSLEAAFEAPGERPAARKPSAREPKAKA